MLRLQLEQLPIFADLTDGEFALLRAAVELRAVSAGDVILDEHDRCAGLYIVRAGVVKLVQRLSPLVGHSLRTFPQPESAERTLSYCSRGEIIGLADLLCDRPNSASAIAVGHPGLRSRVDLAFLTASAFWQLFDKAPRFREPLKREIARLRRPPSRAPTVLAGNDPILAPLPEEAETLGLVQGQRLMLIDLNRCTRCDECVRACANSHNDGRSRLYLNGPRFGRFLVPTTCQACLDPVCLIGCPVNSIHRGEKGEIRIEDWCIGCGLCGDSCPYGAIQLQDTGILPDRADGWHLLPREGLCDDAWLWPGFRARNWLPVSTPLQLDRTLREQLAAHHFSAAPPCSCPAH